MCTCVEQRTRWREPLFHANVQIFRYFGGVTSRARPLLIKEVERSSMDSLITLMTATTGLALGVGLARLALAVVLALTFDRHQ